MGGFKNKHKKERRSTLSNFSSLLRNTLDDLHKDLRGNTKTKSEATVLGDALKCITPSTDIPTVLRDKESALYKAIPIDVLRQTNAGREYIKIFKLVTDFPEPASVATGSSEALYSDIQQKMPASVRQLTEDFQREFAEAAEDGNIDFMKLLTRSAEVVQERQNSGDLNVQEIESFFNQMQSTPAFQEALASPEMQTLVGALGTMGGGEGGPADLSSLMGMFGGAGPSSER